MSGIHHRHSIRMIGYDYTQPGLYFITICVKDRECSFGKIINGKMIVNLTGAIANKCWLEIPNHFSHTILHEFIVMPNHVHGIIELKPDAGASHAGASHAGASHAGASHAGASHVGASHVGASHVMPLPQPNKNQFSKPITGSVSVIIQQYKSSVKRLCNKNRITNFQWQSRFYDHIIRNEISYHRIAEYIINNPANWKGDNPFDK